MKPTEMNDGGPAFPGALATQDNQSVSGGMSLRDYLAAHAPMPNATEACSVVGWVCRDNTPRPKNDSLSSDEYRAWMALPTFQDLWNTISNEKRAWVCATFQYLFADAMLAAREVRRAD